MTETGLITEPYKILQLAPVQGGPSDLVPGALAAGARRQAELARRQLEEAAVRYLAAAAQHLLNAFPEATSALFYTSWGSSDELLVTGVELRSLQGEDDEGYWFSFWDSADPGAEEVAAEAQFAWAESRIAESMSLTRTRYSFPGLENERHQMFRLRLR